MKFLIGAVLIVTSSLVIPTPIYAQTLATSLISKYSDQYGVSRSVMHKVLLCESGLQSIQSKIPNKNGPNGRENSWGIAQIHLPSHPGITRKQAMDPDFAIKWTAKQFALGNQRMWSCYVSLSKRGVIGSSQLSVESGARSFL